jgi:cell division protein FtsB
MGQENLTDSEEELLTLIYGLESQARYKHIERQKMKERRNYRFAGVMWAGLGLYVTETFATLNAYEEAPFIATMGLFAVGGLKQQLKMRTLAREEAAKHQEADKLRDDPEYEDLLSALHEERF